LYAKLSAARGLDGRVGTGLVVVAILSVFYGNAGTDLPEDLPADNPLGRSHFIILSVCKAFRGATPKTKAYLLLSL